MTATAESYRLAVWDGVVVTVFVGNRDGADKPQWTVLPNLDVYICHEYSSVWDVFAHR
jgi:hypothetical protein